MNPGGWLVAGLGVLALVTIWWAKLGDGSIIFLYAAIAILIWWRSTEPLWHRLLESAIWASGAVIFSVPTLRTARPDPFLFFLLAVLGLTVVDNLRRREARRKEEPR